MECSINKTRNKTSETVHVDMDSMKGTEQHPTFEYSRYTWVFDTMLGG